jgi:hypothetical protein
MLQRELVVFAQTFDITRFEARGFGASDRAPDGGEEMIGKHVAIHKRAAGSLLGARRAHDRVMEKLTAGTEQLEGSGKIIIKAFFRNMFGRADAGDAIEGFAGPELEKVFHCDAALKAAARMRSRATSA